MALKRQHVFRNALSTRIACDTLASLVLSAFTDLGYKCRGFCDGIEDNSASIRLACTSTPSRDDVGEVENYVMRTTGMTVGLEFVQDYEGLGDERSLLERASRNARRLTLDALMPLLGSSDEYAMLVGWNGYAAVLQGEERRVNIIGRYVLVAHTHPRSVCLPSHYDIETTARHLADGACCTLILSPACLFVARRVETLSLDDYDTLMELARKMSRVRQLEDALQLLSLFNSQLKTVKLHLYSL